MSQKLTPLDLTRNNPASNHQTLQIQNLKITQATSKNRFRPESPKFRPESPKMFQRKPSQRFFDRKDQKNTHPQTKICYISPQKPQHLIKCLNLTQNSNQDESFFTVNQHSGQKEQLKKQPQISQLLDLSRILQPDLKNIENNSCYFNKRNQIHKNKNYQPKCNIQTSRTSFQTSSLFEDVDQHISQSHLPNTQIYEKADCANDFSAMLSPSSMRLSSMKEIQFKIQYLVHENIQKTNQIRKLKDLIKRKDNNILELEDKIKQYDKQFQQISNRLKQHQINQSYKILYYQSNQKLRYLKVENDILKKLMDVNKGDAFKIQRLQNLNKILTAKNKSLRKQMEDMQSDQFYNKRQNKYMMTKLNNKQLAKGINQINYKNTESSVKISKKRSNSALASTEQRNFFKGDLNMSKALQNAEGIQIQSNGSSLELSLENTPEKAIHGFNFRETQDILNSLTENKPSISLRQ